LRNEPEKKIQQHLEKNIEHLFKGNDSIEISENSKWKKDTILVTGDSMISGIQQARLSKKREVKVRPLLGASIRDMDDYLKPLLRKEPSN